MSQPNYNTLLQDFLATSYQISPNLTIDTATEHPEINSENATNLLEFLGEELLWQQTIPPTQSIRYKLPKTLPEPLQQALLTQGIKSLYSHQIEALKAIRKGQDIILSTSTASGKTLSAFVPILEGIINHNHTALCFYGLKALTADQGEKLSNLLAGIEPEYRPQIAILNGDIHREKRQELLQNHPRIIGATPELMHYALRGVYWSQPWQQFLQHLRYIVVDEAHTFQGKYGSNMANLLRRLKLAVDSQGGQFERLQFIFLSATVGNPVQLAGRLSGRIPACSVEKSYSLRYYENRGADSGREKDFSGLSEQDWGNKGKNRLVHISESGAATPERQLLVTKPSSSANSDTAKIILFLLRQGLKGICFGNGRQTIKHLLNAIHTEAAAQGYQGIEQQVAIFYGGLTGERRTEILHQLQAQQVRCLLSTSALEAGIDLDALDFVVIRGYPDSLQAFRQRIGRAGRKRRGLAVFIPLESSPIDRYFAERPELLLEAEAESVAFNADYPIDLGKHLMCACVESNIPTNRLKYYFGKASLPLINGLMEQGAIRQGRGRFWAKEFPHREVNFRGGIAESTVQLVEADSGEVIEEMSAGIAYREVFTGAIYRSQNSAGQILTYRSVDLDLITRKATLERIPETPLYTVAFSDLTTEIKGELIPAKTLRLAIPESSEKPNVQLTLNWGEISQSVRGYQLLLRQYELTCFNRRCVKFKELLGNYKTCPVCGRRTRRSELTKVIEEIEFENPYRLQFTTPIVQIRIDSTVRDYLQNIANQMRRELLQASETINKGYEALWNYPSQLLALHSFGHQILAALPLVILSSQHSVSYLVQKQGNDGFVGYF